MVAMATPCDIGCEYGTTAASNAPARPARNNLSSEQLGRNPLSSAARPLPIEEVLAQRDALSETVSALLARVKQIQTETDAAVANTSGAGPLSLDRAILANETRNHLQALIAETVVGPRSCYRWRTSAHRSRVSRDCRSPSRERRSGDPPSDQRRQREAANGPERCGPIVKGRKRPDQKLLIRNNRIARNRIDRLLLQSIAADQNALADRAALKPPPKAVDLVWAQRVLLARLQQIIAESDSLRNGMKAAVESDISRLAGAQRISRHNCRCSIPLSSSSQPRLAVPY